jgi:hypothetical protein
MTQAPDVRARLDRYFDADYYVAAYEDVARSGMSPLDHYLRHGWVELRRPNVWYSESLTPLELAQANPGMPPFLLLLATASDALLQSYQDAVPQVNRLGHADCWQCDAMRDDFDADYYHARYPDIAGLDALAHFCENGWREWRSPAAWFDTRYYEETNQDVAVSGINPFVHYLNNGVHEGRKPKPLSSPRRHLLHGLKAIPVINRDYRDSMPVTVVQRGPALTELLATRLHGRKGFVSVSHDNYLQQTGGIQKFIRDEAADCSVRRRVHIHLYPVLPRLGVSSDVTPLGINVAVDGAAVCTTTIGAFCTALVAARGASRDTLETLCIHSLMGWTADGVAALAKLDFARTFFYAHDYGPLCQEHKLLRNGVENCDNPPLDSPSCRVCVHGRERPANMAIYAQIFDLLKPTLIYPSPTAKHIYERDDFYRQMNSITAGHIEVEVSAKAAKTAKVVNASPTAHGAGNPLKIAYCGSAAPHKGYTHFAEIVEACRSDPRLRFVHIGYPLGSIENIEHVDVQLEDGRSPMPAALAQTGVDIAFVGSIWRETFNYVAYEALAARVPIITFAASGNVAALVARHEIGAVVADLDEAVALLKGETLAARVADWKKNMQALQLRMPKLPYWRTTQ